MEDEKVMYLVTLRLGNAYYILITLKLWLKGKLIWIKKYVKELCESRRQRALPTDPVHVTNVKLNEGLFKHLW